MELNFENTVLKYFSDLNDEQRSQFKKLKVLYEDWNDKINVVSRKDIDALYLHHVLHSLSIANFIEFSDGTKVLDLGTGGGFPGIPLAILFPDCNFLMIDGKAKKIKVVNAVIEELGLKNCVAKHQRSEELKMKFDFVVARAVTQLERLVPLTQHLISSTHMNVVPNGLIALKGGNVKDEIKALGKGYDAEIIPIDSFFDEEYFSEKYIIYLQI